ncbi:MAG: hypothetical protein ABSA76_02335 [Bacteroidales bacterium]
MARTIYIFIWKENDGKAKETKPISCSNKRILANRTHLGYDNIMRIFTRQGKYFWEDSEHIIIKIYEGDILRGRQKIKVSGKRFGDNY